MRNFLIFSLFAFNGLFSLSAQSDFQKIYKFGVGYSDIIGVEEEDNYLYLAAGFYNEDSLWGHKLVKMDTLGHIIKELDMIKRDTKLTTHLTFSGFNVMESGKILFWGSTDITASQNVNYLVFANTSLDSYYVRYYFSDSLNLRESLNHKILVTPNCYYLLGDEQLSDYSYNGFVMRTDTQGNVLWRRSYGLGHRDESIRCAAVMGENEIVLGGYWSDPEMQKKWEQNPAWQPFWDTVWASAWMFGIDTLGNVLWEWNRFGDSSTTAITSLHSKDGRLYYTSAFPFYQGLHNGYTFKSFAGCVGTDRKTIWERKPPALDRDWFAASTLTPDSAAMVCAGGPGFGGLGITYKVGLDGREIFYRQDTLCRNDTITELGEIYFYDVAALSSGSTVACGKILARFAGDGWRTHSLLIKVNASGVPDTLLCGAWVPVAAPPVAAPLRLALSPVPAYERVTVSLPPDAPPGTRLRVYGMVGGLVHEQAVPPGEVAVDVTVNAWPPGVYAVQWLGRDGRILGVGRLVKS